MRASTFFAEAIRGQRQWRSALCHPRPLQRLRLDGSSWNCVSRARVFVCVRRLELQEPTLGVFGQPASRLPLRTAEVAVIGRAALKTVVLFTMLFPLCAGAVVAGERADAHARAHLVNRPHWQIGRLSRRGAAWFAGLRQSHSCSALLFCFCCVATHTDDCCQGGAGSSGRPRRRC